MGTSPSILSLPSLESYDIGAHSHELVQIFQERLADIFKKGKRWRADGHIGVNWLTQELHKRAKLLKGLEEGTEKEISYEDRTETKNYDAMKKKFLFPESPLIKENESLSVSEKAALDCAAIVKVQTCLAKLSDAASSILLLNNARLTGLFQMYFDRISLEPHILDSTEIVPLFGIMDGLDGVMKRPNPRITKDAPILGNLALPLRLGKSVHRVAATGTRGPTVDTQEHEAADAFILAHMPKKK